MRETCGCCTRRAPRGLPPFTSGLVGYLGYDAVRRLERLPDSNLDDLQIPELRLPAPPTSPCWTTTGGEVWLVANAINYDGRDDRVDEAYADAVARVEAMTGRLAGRSPPPVVCRPVPGVTCRSGGRPPEEFQSAVAMAGEEIKAGEAFQVVVSQRFEVDTTADALDVYRVLRATNPSPYMYLLRLDGFDIVGSSPEALVTVKDGTAITHPIAGSKPRGATPARRTRRCRPSCSPTPRSGPST